MKRTQNEPNTVVHHGDYVEIILFDVYGNEKARAKVSTEKLHLVTPYRWWVGRDG